MLKNEIQSNVSTSSCYLQVNMDLFNNNKYKNLDLYSVILYSFYVNRLHCSIYNSGDGSWKTNDDRFYILFSNAEAAKILGVSTRKVTDYRKKLIDAGLIEVQKYGLKQNRIFVAEPDHKETTEDTVVPYKNVQYKHKNVVKPQSADNSTSNSHDIPTSTINNQVIDTRDTKETANLPKTSTNPFSEIDDATMIDALKARYEHLLNPKIFTRIQQITKNNYTQTKWYLDTIFKAKHSAEQLFLAAKLPFSYFDTLTFETNTYFKDKLENAIIVTIEQMYRYKKVNNKQGFFFIFMRGFFIEQVKEYIADNFEMNHKLINILNSVQNKKPKREVQVC